MAIKAEVNVKIDIEALEAVELITLANGEDLTLEDGTVLPIARADGEVLIEDGEGEVRFLINGEVYSANCAFDDADNVVGAGPLVKGSSYLITDAEGKRIMVGDRVVFATVNGLATGTAIRAGAQRMTIKTGVNEETGKDICSNPMFINVLRFA